MRITIENVLGIQDAQLEMQPGQVLEVVGPNASGKTSIAACAQALLAQDVNPLGVGVAEARKAYLRDGVEEGLARLEDGGDEIVWRPKAGSLTAPTQGAPHARPEAVGMIDFTVRRAAKERATVLQSALLPEPQKVLAAVRERLARYIPPGDVDGVIQMVQQRGWSAAEAVYADRAREAKRTWSAHSGRNYGVKIALDWRPDGWLADYDNLTVQEAEEAVVVARDALAALHRVQAVSEAELRQAEEAAEEIPDLEEACEDARKARDELREKVTAVPIDALRRDESKITTGLMAARQFDQKAPFLECPNCAEPLVVHNRTLVPFDRDGWKKVKMEHEESIPGLEESLRDVTERLDQARQTRRELADRLEAMNSAVATAETHLANARHQAERTGELDSADRRTALAEAEQEVENAKGVVSLVQAEQATRTLNETIARYTEVAKAIGPQGIRQQLLAKGMRQLNSGLKKLCELAEWPLVRVAENGSATWNDRPVAMCSESERWRAQAFVQLTLAAITKSKAVVLDRVDLLDDANRKGLVAAVDMVIGKTNMAALVCGTGGTYASSPWPQREIRDGKMRA